MDKNAQADATCKPEGADDAKIEAASGEYLGRWNRLVSTTNWEKGRIICEWRRALIEASAPPASFSDEAWSRRVGNVTPQHVGRLRRVYQRFGEVYEQYRGLYWSHFQAAVDWPDAEMWLEGAVQNSWPVARMRHVRWETLGAEADKRPREQEIVTAEPDEDFAGAEEQAIPAVISESLGMVRDAGPPAGDVPGVPFREPGPPAEQATVEPFRPFGDLPPLPRDLYKAFHAFRRAILRHKLSGWQRVSPGDVLAVLDALKALTLAPAEE